MIKREKGFTLIELLVVIAIIGILSSVVLASLNSARGKGSNAAVKAGLANMRAEAALFYDLNGSYTNICTTDSVIGSASSSIAANASAVFCGSSASNFVMAATWKAGNTDASGLNYCVDSNGYAGGTSSLPTVGALPCK